MPDLKINTNNTRTSACYVRYPHATVNFSNLFFPYFSSLWLSLNQKVKSQRDLLVFKENLKVVYKPVRHRHFKYGTKTGKRCLAHLRVGRSFLNSQRFVTKLSDTDKCKNCNQNQTGQAPLITDPPQISFTTLSGEKKITCDM